MGRLLIVEDDKDFAAALQIYFTSLGHDVLTCGDGETAVGSIESRNPEVVLIDIGLPGIDGYETARQIRTACRHQPIIIALTGRADLNDRERSLAAGMDYHVAKPADLEFLRALIGDALSC